MATKAPEPHAKKPSPFQMPDPAPNTAQPKRQKAAANLQMRRAA
jgi:hypothetical protein